jgi:predicted RND superfamily exporter protein
MSGWTLGLIIGLVVVVAVVALVTPIILLARGIAARATKIDRALVQARTNTAPLAALSTTIDHAEKIVAGLARGRTRLGG